MAYSNDSAITGKIRGSINKELVFRKWEDKTIVAKSPSARKKGSETTGQKEHRRTFQIATKYAKAILKNEDMKDGYTAVLKKRQNVYARALEDFMNPPTIETINTQKYNGNIGDVITIRAVDDFRITELFVELRTANSEIIEQGTAVLNLNGLDWLYTATKANAALQGSLLKVTASDVPGNSVEKEVVI